jgi:hypothetical protein
LDNKIEQLFLAIVAIVFDVELARVNIKGTTAADDDR